MDLTPPPRVPGSPLSQGLPSFTSSIASDSELSLGASLSRNMWTSNPGYVARDGARMASTAHQDFTYDEDEVGSRGEGGGRERVGSMARVPPCPTTVGTGSVLQGLQIGGPVTCPRSSPCHACAALLINPPPSRAPPD